MTDALNRLFPDPEWPAIPVGDGGDLYPVHRVFCVGRNYAEHAKEMGVEVDREAPFYFLKGAYSVVRSGETIAYPPGTENFHYEMELAVAIARPVFKEDVSTVGSAIFGYACALDMTRRDLQLNARAKQRPWDLGKDFESSTVIATFIRAEEFAEIGPQRIWLTVDGAVKQDAHLADLIWSVPELISHLSRYYHLQPGDVILTGTPAGVGPVVPGNKIAGGIDGLDKVTLGIGPAE
jgi:fumarylpyruvate hydrolase